MTIPSSLGSRGLNLVHGFTLIEVCCAMATLGIFLSGIVVMHSHLLGILRTTNDTVSAAQALQERIEQMRIANWTQITDANYLATNLLATSTPSANALTSPVETVLVSAYPLKAGFTSIELVRQNNAVTIKTANSAMRSEKMVQVEVLISWRGYPNNRLRTKGTLALIAKGGIAK